MSPKRAASGSKSGNVGRSELLDVFVCGKENAYLLDLFDADNMRSWSSFSPIYLFGGHGVGKSALSISLAERYRRALDADAITWVEGSDFARSLAMAIDSDDMDRFRSKHRDCDLLVIDGLDDLAKKVSAQDELVSILDYRERKSLATIATALNLPHTVRGLKQNLVSRFLGGFTLELHYPELEARRAIIEHFLKKLEVIWSDDQIERFCSRIEEPLSAPELQSLLLSWLHHERLLASQPTSTKKSTLDELIDERQRSKIPDIADIAKLVAQENHLKVSDLRGATRKSQIVRARSIAMYLARQLTPLSFQQIGAYFGRRDHTTVMHACSKLESSVANDVELQRVIELVKRHLD